MIANELYSVTGYLSPQNLKTSGEQESVVFYTMAELELAEDKKNGQVTKSMTIEKKVKDGNQTERLRETVNTKERVSDVLIAGVDQHFIKLKGAKCSFDWMLQEPKKRLLTILDNADEDHQVLARLLNVKSTEYCATNGSTSTEALIQHWCKKCGKQMSLQALHTILKHPGLVGNRDAASVIEEMLQEVGHEVRIHKIREKKNY